MIKVIVVVLFLIPFHLSANEQELLDILKVKQLTKQSLKVSTTAGDKRALLCKYCHGVDGNSVKTSIPNLASQNSVYLIRQFELFATGQRTNKTMNEIARLLTAEDKVNIALFYSSQKVKAQPKFKPELVSTGKRVFETKCFFCHGKDGYGKQELPRIAGQPAEYVIKTLSSYTSSLSKRAETAMSRVARALKKDEIKALASYLNSLK